MKGSFRFPLVAGSPASVPSPINCWLPSCWIQPKTSSTVWSAYWKSRFHLGWSSEQFLVWGTPQGCNWTQESISLLLAFLLSSRSHILKFIFKKVRARGQHGSRGHWCQNPQHGSSRNEGCRVLEGGIRTIQWSDASRQLLGALKVLLRLGFGVMWALQSRRPEGADRGPTYNSPFGGEFSKSLRERENLKPLGHPFRGWSACWAGNVLSSQSKSIVLLENLLPKASVDTGDHEWGKTPEGNACALFFFLRMLPFPGAGAGFWKQQVSNGCLLDKLSCQKIVVKYGTLLAYKP